jgi:PTEN phosphatase family protein
MAVAQFVMAPPGSSATESEEVGSAQSATTPLRIVGRVAMGLRVLRVLINMRKVNELKGTVATKIRTAVSQNKRRYQANGFDMDLTYITNRVIAMSAPALGDHAAYRNDCNVVSRFLSLQHYASFFIFNLCDTCISSDGVIGNYHPMMFFNQVQRIPFEDHGPPLLVELIQFCREASKWLSRDNAHIVNVHCKGGKGRTGVMIAALLLWSGHRKCAMDAMELFAFRRTSNWDPAADIDHGDDGDEGGKGVCVFVCVRARACVCP